MDTHFFENMMLPIDSFDRKYIHGTVVLRTRYSKILSWLLCIWDI